MAGKKKKETISKIG